MLWSFDGKGIENERKIFIPPLLTHYTQNLIKVGMTSVYPSPGSALACIGYTVDAC